MIDIENLSDPVIDLLCRAWWEGYDAGVAQCGADEGYDTKGGMQREENPYAGVTEARQLERLAAMEVAVNMLEEKFGPPSEEAMEEVRRLFEEEQHEQAVAYSR